MPKNVEEVRVAVDGIVSSGPRTVAAPTAVDSALTGYADLGYVSEDGVTESNTQSTEVLRAWQKAKIVRTLVTEGETTFALTLIQTNADTLGEYYGVAPEADGSFITSATNERPHRKYVLDIFDGDEWIRKYIADGQVTEVGDQVFQNGAAIGYEVTITAYDDDELGGSVQHWVKSLDAA
jgi:hypothetical protein